MGQSPPCRTFRLLTSLEVLASYRNQIDQAMTKDDAAFIAATMTAFKQALLDLITMTKAANVRFKKPITAIAEQEAKASESAKHESADQSKRRKVSVKPQGSTWDTAASLGNDVLAFRSEAGKPVTGIDVAKPAIVCLEPSTQAFEQGSKLVSASAPLMEKYKADIARNEPGRRAQTRLGPEAAPELETLCNAVFPEETRLHQTPPVVTESVLPIAFAMTTGRETCASEAGHLGSMRVGIKGTCSIVFAPIPSVSKFIDSAAIPFAESLSPFQVLHR